MPSVLGMMALHHKGRPLCGDTGDQHCSLTADTGLPQDSNPAFTRYANVPKQGPGQTPLTTLWQEHWPTPTPAEWQQTEQLVARVAAVLDWTYNPVQGPKLQHQDVRELWETLMELLSTLVLGHVMDMSLVMCNVFCASFSAVFQGWAIIQGVSGHAEVEVSSLPDKHVSQMARALLRRLGADKHVCAVAAWSS